MAKLALVRHGQSTWNAKGVWSGITEVPLSLEGKNESQKAAKKLMDVRFDVIFISSMIRAKETLEQMKPILGLSGLEVIENKALNEKDYGEFTGKNKWQIEKKYGKEEFQKIRRSWDYPIKNGETLKDVYDRVVPYYDQLILPILSQGKNVLVVAHGNSLRALVKYLEGISDTDIGKLEIDTGGVWIYTLDQNGSILEKEVR